MNERVDIFGADYEESLKEVTGALLAKKDHAEDRHSRKKTDEDVYEDFEFDRQHPFALVLIEDARAFEKSGEAFVLQDRIAILKNVDEENKYLYINGGVGQTWRTSGNALFAKYLKEKFPDLYVPRMKFGCKGETLLLKRYPNNFKWIRAVYKEREEQRRRSK